MSRSGIRKGKRCDSHRQVDLAFGLTITLLKYHIEGEGLKCVTGEWEGINPVHQSLTPC